MVATIDELAALLVERARPIAIRAASSQAEIEAAQRLRGRAILERGWADADSLTADGRDEDPFDATATHVVALDGSDVCGTCRLLRREAGPARGMEIGRVTVVCRPWAVTGGLIGFSWLEARRSGHERITGNVSAGVLRLYRRMGFLVEVLGPPAVTYGEERFPIAFEATIQSAEFAARRLRSN